MQNCSIAVALDNVFFSTRVVIHSKKGHLSCGYEEAKQVRNNDKVVLDDEAVHAPGPSHGHRCQDQVEWQRFCTFCLDNSEDGGQWGSAVEDGHTGGQQT